MIDCPVSFQDEPTGFLRVAASVCSVENNWRKLKREREQARIE